MAEHKVIRQERPDFTKLEKSIIENTKPKGTVQTDMDIVLIHTIYTHPPGTYLFKNTEEWGVWAVAKKLNKYPLATGLMDESEAQFIFDAVMEGIHLSMLYQKPRVF